MSKFARKPIPMGEVQITISNNKISYKGKHASGVYTLPKEFFVRQENGFLFVEISDDIKAQKKIALYAQWGLHKALLANTIMGADKLFERQVKIEGLGFKAQLQGSLITFSLGFSHKKTYELPKEVTVDIDRSGQLLTFKSAQKDILGHVCSCVKSFRKVEPYKGKGIFYVGEFILRKAGKASSR
jgi:large subunit ribosomal protein L6